MQADNGAPDPIVDLLNHTPLGQYSGPAIVIVGIIRIVGPALLDLLKSWRSARSGHQGQVSPELAYDLARDRIIELLDENSKHVARIAHLEKIIREAGLTA